MSIHVIDKIKPLGSFKVADAHDIECEGNKGLDEVLNEKSNKSDLANKADTEYVNANFAKKNEIPDIPDWAKSANKPTYTKSEIGLSNVDNTSDESKPLSHDARIALNEKANVSMVTEIANRVSENEIEITKLKVNKVYTNVSGMMFDTTLSTSDIVQVLGYYDNGDGGKATYIIKNSLADDDVYVELSNGKYAVLVLQDEMNPMQFGYQSDLAPVFEKMDKVKHINLEGGEYQLKSYSELSHVSKISNGIINISRLSTEHSGRMLLIKNNNFTLANVKIDVTGEYGDAGNNRYVIVVDGIGNIIHDCEFTGLNTMYGISNANCIIAINGDAIIRNCDFFDIAKDYTNPDGVLVRGINLLANSKLEVNGCTFTHCSQGIGSSGLLTVRNCRFEHIQDNGVYAFDTTRIYDSYFEDNEEAVVTSKDLYISGSSFYNNTNTALSFGGEGDQTVEILNSYFKRDTLPYADRYFTMRKNYTLKKFVMYNCYVHEDTAVAGSREFDMTGCAELEFINCYIRSNINGWGEKLIDTNGKLTFSNCIVLSDTNGKLTNSPEYTVFNSDVRGLRHEQEMVRNVPFTQSNINAVLGSGYVGIGQSAPSTVVGFQLGSFIFNSGNSNILGWRNDGTKWVEVPYTVEIN